MSLLICVKVPLDAAKVLSSIDVPGDKEDLSGAHITLTYTPKEDTSVGILGRVLEVLVPILENTRPFPVYTSRVSVFEATSHSDGRIPIICRVDSNELHVVRDKISKALDSNGIPYAKNFPIYKPHITLAYAQDTEDLKNEWSDKRIPTVSFGVNALTVLLGWNGETVEASVPLHLGKIAALRVLSKFLQSKLQ